MKQLLFSFLTVFFGVQTQAQLFPSRIIGKNDLIPVNREATNIPAPYQRHVEAIGWTNYGCTVTHLGKGIAISAGHCFDATSNLKFNQSCGFVSVKWGFRQNKRPSLTSNCKMILALQKNTNADFAILKFSEFPQATVEVDWDKTLNVGDLLTFFSHPAGRPLEWSQFCDLKAPNSGSSIPMGKMSYTCDSEGGSSGAAVLSATSGKIVGIHNGGYSYMNYGTYLSEGKLRELLMEYLVAF